MQPIWSILSSPAHYKAPFSDGPKQMLSLTEKIAAISAAILVGFISFGVGGIITFFLVSGYFKSRHLKPIYLFCGDENYTGISMESVNAVEDKIKQTFEKNLVVRCNAKQMRPVGWNQHGVLIFPGGKCSDWDQLLTKEQQGEILDWVKQGGKVWGICAGAYYCSAQSEYQFSLTQKIARIRQINLFSGICRGPAYREELKVVKVRWERTGQTGYVAVIKGGFFVPTGKDDKVLARYIDQPIDESIAVVKCQQNAILSGPHWEFDARHLEPLKENIQDVEQMQKQLDESIIFRQNCIREILNLLVC